MLRSRTHWLRTALLALAIAAPTQQAPAQDPKPQSTTRAKPLNGDDVMAFEIYGFGMADAIYEFGQSNPDWFDVNRPSRLPAFEDEFGRDGRFWLSARQSRFGAKATHPSWHGKPFTAVFEFDLFGVGTDAGQTTIRPRHMYGQWGEFGAGQTNSVFMDVDVFPNTIEYWGPNGMLFFRNVMVWWQPINEKDGTRATIAIERPGASGDGGVFADRIELQNVSPRFPAPDISAEYRYGTGWGYLELAGVTGWFAWDDNLPNDAFDLSGDEFGWGLSLSSNVNLDASKDDVLRLQVIYGEGVANYFNDAPIDVGLRSNFGNTVTPVTGEALPIFGMSAYLDHRWNSSWTSSIGYSRVDVDNSDLQSIFAFKSGQYASVNVLYNPFSNFLVGPEFLWAHRDNFGDDLTGDPFDDFSFDNFRLQFSAKYSFSHKFGGSK